MFFSFSALELIITITVLSYFLTIFSLPSILQIGKKYNIIDKPSSIKIVQPEVGANDRYIWYANRTNSWQYNAGLPQYQISKFKGRHTWILYDGKYCNFQRNPFQPV